MELVTRNIPQNIAVSSIVFDPNNTNVFYVGTGESYTAGDALGNGLWKSDDGGDSWFKVFGGDTENPTTYVSEGNKIEIKKTFQPKIYRFFSCFIWCSIDRKSIGKGCKSCEPPKCMHIYLI